MVKVPNDSECPKRPKEVERLDSVLGTLQKQEMSKQQEEKDPISFLH